MKMYVLPWVLIIGGAALIGFSQIPLDKFFG